MITLLLILAAIGLCLNAVHLIRSKRLSDFTIVTNIVSLVLFLYFFCFTLIVLLL